MKTLQDAPEYKCHKIVRALKVGKLEHIPGGAIVTPVLAEFTQFKVDSEYINRCSPGVGGYVVLYSDGFMSYSPPGTFTAGYTPVIGANTTDTTDNTDVVTVDTVLEGASINMIEEPVDEEDGEGESGEGG